MIGSKKKKNARAKATVVRVYANKSTKVIQALTIFYLIIYMKKLLDSDWLRAVQFKCNTSAKSVKPVQITHRNSDLIC